MTYPNYSNWWVLRILQELKGEKLLQGIAGSRGIAIGPVKNVGDSDPKLLAQIRPGDIVVGVGLHPGEFSFCRTAAALIIDTGGRTHYTSIFATEMKKPAVVGTKEATHILKDGQKVIADGTEGTVYAIDKGHLDIEVALTKMGDSRLKEALERLVYKHNGDECTVTTVYALGEIKDKQAVMPLIAVLEDEKATRNDHFLTNAVIWSLGEIRDIRGVEPLMQLLRHVKSYRSATIEALGKIGDPKAIATLINILEDKQEDESTRDNVVKAFMLLDDRKLLKDTRIKLPLQKYLNGKIEAMPTLKAMAEKTKEISEKTLGLEQYSALDDIVAELEDITKLIGQRAELFEM